MLREITSAGSSAARASAVAALVLTLAPTTGCGAFDNGGSAWVGETGGGSTGGGDVTIYQIQRGEVSEGSSVTITGAVVTSPYHAGEGGVFVEDPDGGEWSGIYVYFEGKASVGVELDPGDVLDFTGVYVESFGASQITISDQTEVQLVGSGEPVPEPVVVAPADITTGGALAENYEGVLVRVENVVCTDPDPGFGEFVVTDGLHADDFFYSARPNQGDEFDAIVGPLHYAFEEFKILPRSAADLVGWGGDGDGDGDGDAVDATIYEVQGGMIAEGTTVTITGAIVTTPMQADESLFWIQDAMGGAQSGIAVFAQGATMAGVAPGDVVTLTGEYSEFFGLSELTVFAEADLEITGTAPVPDAEVLAPADIATAGALAEDYEGVLVRVENVTVLDVSLGFGEFSVTGELRVDDFFFDMAAWTLPNVDDTYASITGPLTYSFDNFKVLPRDAADLAP